MRAQSPKSLSATDATRHAQSRLGPFMASLALTPRRHLLFTVADDALQLPPALLRRLEGAFARGSGHGLLELGASQVGTALPPDLSYWRDVAARLVTSLCTHPDLETHHAPMPAPVLGELDAIAAAAPPMTGAEYITGSVRRVSVAEGDGRGGRDLSPAGDESAYAT